MKLELDYESDNLLLLKCVHCVLTGLGSLTDFLEELKFSGMYVFNNIDHAMECAASMSTILH